MPEWGGELVRWFGGLGVGGLTLVGAIKVLAPESMDRGIKAGEASRERLSRTASRVAAEMRTAVRARPIGPSGGPAKA